jgi:hypothetical protein
VNRQVPLLEALDRLWQDYDRTPTVDAQLTFETRHQRWGYLMARGEDA